MEKIQEFIKKECGILNTFDDGHTSFFKHLEKVPLSYIMFAFFRKNPGQPLRIDSSSPAGFGNLSHPKSDCATWIFLKEDGSEAFFEDQPQETQIAIAKLLGYNC